MSHLKRDEFDTDKLIEGLQWKLEGIVGKPVMRMAGPELRSFLEFEVRQALHDAFAEAESLYLRDMIQQSEQSTRTLLEGVLAGVHLGQQSKEGE